MLALHPLDVIKTRLQVQDGAGSLPMYRGTIDALRSMAREEGWRALYAGEQRAAAAQQRRRRAPSPPRPSLICPAPLQVSHPH